MPEHQNIHGRRSGRGVRPWLLIPKYVCVSLVIGGLFSAGTLCSAANALGPDERRRLWNLVGLLFRYQIIPATVASIVLGIVLLMQHPRELLRTRWLGLKIALVVVTVPVSHLCLSMELHHLESEPMYERKALANGLLYALPAFITIAIVGRLKPRLGQKYRST